MAAQGRRTTDRVTDALLEEGYRFDFFQAVRLLESLYPDRRPVGRDASPSQEVVRFHAHQSVSFPPSPICEIRPCEDDQTPAQMTVAFIGLTGPLGVMPQHYTEVVMERMTCGDFALRDFLDLFNHRLIALFYRVWEKHDLVAVYERGLVGKFHDPIARLLFGLMGLSQERVRRKLEVRDRTLLGYTGMLANRRRSASALRGLLTEYFEVPVSVVQFTGEWLPLDAETCTRLGVDGTALGHSTTLGTSVWDPHARFRLRIGPLTHHESRRWLPPSEAFDVLTALTRQFTRTEFNFDVQLILRAGDIPAWRLGDMSESGPRLGFHTWLQTSAYIREPADLVLGVHLTSRRMDRGTFEPLSGAVC